MRPLLTCILLSLPLSGLHAQDHPMYEYKAPDILEVSRDGYSVVIYYSNSTDKKSIIRYETHEYSDVTVKVSVEIGPGTEEILTVTTRTPGWIVVPREVSWVDDGAEITIYVIPAAS